MEAVSFGRALYYPHIFPQSRQWLRTAALYHDGIGRIVPRGFVPAEYDRHNGPALLEDFNALQEAGFIEDDYPNHVLGEVSKEFLDFIAPHLQSAAHKGQLVTKLGSSAWKPYNMYREKIAPELLELLEPEGLVRSVNDHEVEFDASIGGLYMVFLARHIAKHRPIVSDDPLYESLTHIPCTADNAADAGALLATAVFRSAVPIDIESVEIRDLIKFRTDFADERIAFYDCIAKLSADLTKIDDNKQLQQAVAHYDAAIQKRISVLASKLKLLKLTCAQGIFSMSVPGYMTAAWGFGATNLAVLIGTASMVVTGMAVHSLMERGIAKADAPLSYVHSIRDHLAPKAYARKIIQLNLSGRK
jgi:hypothetical protein